MAGPVRSLFDGPLDPWIAAEGCFKHRQLAEGAAIQTAATNNLLLDLREIRELDLRFDSNFRTAGGSDTLFTRELHRRGRGWSGPRTATVHEIVAAAPNDTAMGSAASLPIRQLMEPCVS